MSRDLRPISSLNHDAEAMLLVGILMAIEPSEPGVLDQDIADRIVCDLIEQGLVDMSAAPATYQRWVALGDSSHPDFNADADEDADRETLVECYLEAVES